MAGGTYPSPVSLTDSLLGLTVAPQQRVGPGDNIVYRARAWFTEDQNSLIWRRYGRESKEDVGFYIGGEYQWSKDGSGHDFQKLRDEGRAVITVNHCMSIVDVLVGFERQNRFDLKASPQGAEDDQGAQLWTWLLKFVQDQTEFPELKSECFEDGVIRGMSALHIGMDWTEHPEAGDIVVEVLTPGEDIIWDPRWKKYDLSDASHVIRFRWARVRDLIAQYPDHAKEIEDGVLDLYDYVPSEGRTSTDGSEFGANDSYGWVNGHPRSNPSIESLFYDKKERRALVIEVWYLDYEPQWIVVNEDTHHIQNVESEAIAKEYVKADPLNTRSIRRLRRKIRMALVVPATFTILEEDDSPYTNDSDNYPFVPYIAKRKGDEVFGIIRNLKDPQRVENRRISQVMDILGRYASIRSMYEEDSLLNPNELDDQFSDAPVIVKKGRGAPGWYFPPLAELSRVLTEMALQSKLHMREVSGINTDLLGFRSDDTSGIAIARRQAQGQVISTVFFDNLKRTSKIAGQRLAKRAQQKFTAEEIIRLTNQRGEPVTIRLNPTEFKNMTSGQFEQYLNDQAGDQRPSIIRDVSALKYDIVISDAPATPSARHTALLAMLELMGKMPTAAPILADVIASLADIPDKEKVVRRLHALLPPQILAMEDGTPGAGPGGTPGGPGPGGPPGAPPLPLGTPAAGAGPPTPPPGIPPAAPVAPPPRTMSTGGLTQGSAANLRRALGASTGAGGPASMAVPPS